MVRISVDLNRCEGYGQCVFAAPSAFTLHGLEALTYLPNPPDEMRDAVHRAALACPVQAITVGVQDEPAGTTSRADRHVVVVGASLAGLKTAEALRERGFSGPLTVIGDEPHRPYDRPPLTKACVSEKLPPDRLELPVTRTLDARFLLGTAAVGLDTDRRLVRLADGAAVGYDTVVIATGTRARPYPGTTPDGVLAVRTRDDAEDLQRRLARQPRRVVVVGAGFLGGELASGLCDLGIPVTLVEAQQAPLQGPLGTTVGGVMADLARSAGVDLRLSTTVDEFVAGDDGALRQVRLSDGETVDADLAVVALGAVRNVEWLEGSAARVDRNGVHCDDRCRVLDLEGCPLPDVYAAGDVAGLPHPLFPGRRLSVEHWGNAVTQARTVAHDITRPSGEVPSPHTELPSFWSTQFGVNIKGVGFPGAADRIAVVQGTPGQGSFSVLYGLAERTVGAVTVDNGRYLHHYTALVREGAPFPPEFVTSDENTSPVVRPTGR
ncbi:FAD-dependent oxidoreductase [Streptomyces fuscichromogenes]|uniref:Pyridine nucleotide-disulfide oxidoreductase n=1 Tax=Streptomyces fuscichromogenes TaxID=1324013 RepID=A0A917XH67_9ACTN|nr:FAD-dependent oxidoreductase [Streptomyces fuscichromogenes]GGN23027.1 pyridine nucleotide-disulfide oxidoreductase [Streptomyces fuscichromogenes]